MEYVRLGELCTPNATKISINKDTVIDYIDISSIDNERKEVAKYESYHFIDAPSRARKIVKTNDILVSTVRPNLNAVAILEKSTPNLTVASTGFCVLSCNERVVPRYIYNFCKSKTFIDCLVLQATGASYPAVSDKIVRNVLVPKHTENEQQEIANTLDKLQSIITHRQKQLEKLDELIKARFVEMFGDMILNPNGWEKVLLGEVCDVRDGTHDSPKYFTEGYPLVTSKNVTGGRIDFTDCSLICEEDYNKINQRSKVDSGDILMPMIGTVGNPVIVNIDEEFAIKNVALIKFKENSIIINSFVKALLESDYFDRVVISKVRGGTQKFISLGDIRKLEICLPPLDVQQQFSNFVTQIDKSKVAVQKELDKTKMFFDSLMQEYFG